MYERVRGAYLVCWCYSTVLLYELRLDTTYAFGTCFEPTLMLRSSCTRNMNRFVAFCFIWRFFSIITCLFVVELSYIVEFIYVIVSDKT